MLERFHELNKCPKCKGKSTTKYLSPEFMLLMGYSGLGEMINRKCQRCAFIWLEYTADYEGDRLDLLTTYDELMVRLQEARIKMDKLKYSTINEKEKPIDPDVEEAIEEEEEDIVMIKEYDSNYPEDESNPALEIPMPEGVVDLINK